MPQDIEYLTTTAGRLEYQWLGQGPSVAPTLVFLHEGLGCLALWRDVPKLLSERTGCGALVYFRAGYGRSAPVSLPRPISYMHDEARILDEVLRTTNVQEAVLLGHSDGASIALIYASSALSVKLRGLVLEAPHVFVEQSGRDSIEKISQQYRTTDLRAACPLSRRER